MTESTIAVVSSLANQLTKWKVKKGSVVTPKTVLCLLGCPDTKAAPVIVNATCYGKVKSFCKAEGAKVKLGDSLCIVSICQHEVVMKDLCAICGANLRKEDGRPGERITQSTASIAMVHNIPELHVSEKTAHELALEDEAHLLNEKKLVLLVDLDQTLLHTTCNTVPPDLPEVHHFQLSSGPKSLHSNQWYHTKFRRHTAHFLTSISSLYQLHIVTFGNRLYAHTMAHMLDPESKIFSHRILSRNEALDPLTKTANLKALFPRGDSMVCIIDDRDEVWNYAPNLIHVRPYKYFPDTGDINAPKSESAPGLDPPNTAPASRKPAQTSSPASQDDPKAPDEVPKLNNNSVDSPGQILEVTGKESESIDKASEPFVKSTCVPESLPQKPVEESVDKVSQLSVKPDTAESLLQKSTEKNPVEESVDKASEPSVKSTCVSDTAESLPQEPRENNPANDPGEMQEGDDLNKESKAEEVADVKFKDNAPKVDGEAVGKNNEPEIKESNTQELNKDTTLDKDLYPPDTDDYLLTLADILTRIHSQYYSSSTPGNVRTLLPTLRSGVLANCRLVLSGVIPLGVSLTASPLCRIITSLGGTVQETLVTPETAKQDPANWTTHVVACTMGTHKVKTALRWSRRQDRHQTSSSTPPYRLHVVSPYWLLDSYYDWERKKEGDYCLTHDLDAGLFSSAAGLSAGIPRGARREEVREAEGEGKRKRGRQREERDQNGKKRKRNQTEDEKKVIDDVIYDESTSSSGSSDWSEAERASDLKTKVAACLPRRLKLDLAENPLMQMPVHLAEEMLNEIDGELTSSEDSEEDSDTHNDSILLSPRSLKKKAEKAAGFFDVSESSGDESMSGDYPKGWSPRRQASHVYSHSSEEDDYKEWGSIPEGYDYCDAEEATRVLGCRPGDSDSDRDSDTPMTSHKAMSRGHRPVRHHHDLETNGDGDDDECEDEDFENEDFENEGDYDALKAFL